MGVMGKMDEMKKYIIEFSEDPHTIRLIKVKNGDKFPITEFKTVKPYIESDLEQVRKEAYEEGYKSGYYSDGYQRGLKDAWEAARKISIMDSPTRNEIFGLVITSNIIDENSAPEAIEKIRQYEQEQEEFKLWDEVDGKGGKGIITRISDDGYHFNLMWENGSTGYYMIEDFKKTGRNFPEIAEVLRKMQEVRE